MVGIWGGGSFLEKRTSEKKEQGHQEALEERRSGSLRESLQRSQK